MSIIRNGGNFEGENSMQTTASAMNEGPKTFQSLTLRDHILQRPDPYIESVETVTQSMWTYDSENRCLVKRKVSYVPGFLKVVDEILVNAAYNKINNPSMDTLKIDIDVDEGTISVYDNGRGIPIEIHSKENIYIPELVFGHLSFHYDNERGSMGVSRFALKLANIYSYEFTIDIADRNSGQKYRQTWRNNMGECGSAEVTENSKDEEYTRVTFRPDLKRFGMERIDKDTLSLLEKRVYDMAGTVKDVEVYLNDERLEIKNFKQYAEMYLESAAAQAAATSGGDAQARPTMVYEQISPCWEVAFAVSHGAFEQVSFVNSIATTKGGTHVTYMANQVTKNLVAAIKNNRGAKVESAQIRKHMWIFVNAFIENPAFDSPIKGQLTSMWSRFGTKPVLSEELMKKVLRSIGNALAAQP